MVVDADPALREFEARALCDQGYTVLRASGRGDALRLAFGTANIHLLLTECQSHEPDMLELMQ